MNENKVRINPGLLPPAKEKAYVVKDGWLYNGTSSGHDVVLESKDRIKVFLEGNDRPADLVLSLTFCKDKNRRAVSCEGEVVLTYPGMESSIVGETLCLDVERMFHECFEEA